MKARKICVRALLVVVVLALGVVGSGQTVRANPGIIVGLDMGPLNSASNYCTGSYSDCRLGPIERCISVPNTAGYDFDVDLWVDNLDNGFLAWNDSLSFPNGQLIVQAENVTASLYILPEQSVGSNLINFSDPVPDSVSPHVAAAIDFGTAEATPPFTKGVLDRLTLRVASGAVSGVYGLTLTGPPLGAYLDAGSAEYTVDQIWDANHSPQYGLVALGVDCPGEADIEIVSQQLLSPPTDINMSEDNPVTLRKTVHNQGPDGPVEVTIDTGAEAPADCIATPDPENPTSVNLPVSVDINVDEVWTLHCMEPSTHLFHFSNFIGVPYGWYDPYYSNNSWSTQLWVDVIAPADVKIYSQSLVSPPSEITQGQDVDVTLRKVLHNNGPLWGPNASIAAGGQAPAGCTATPKPGNPTSALLMVSVDTIVDEVWTLNCSEVGSKSFSFQDSISVLDTHVVDPDPGNNSASTPLEVMVLGAYTPAGAVSLSDYSSSVTADITASFDVEYGDYMYYLLYLFTPPSFYVAAAADAPIGALVGTEDAGVALGLSNGACNLAGNFHWDLLNCSVNTSDTISWSDGFLDVNPANGIPDGCDKYPDFLNPLFGGLTPRARLYGQVDVGGGSYRTLNFPVFEPGTCLGVPGCDATWGYPWVAILNNPLEPVPGTTTDVCTPLSADMVTFGVSRDNPATAGDESGFDVRRNPPGADTHTFRWYSTSQRDADADGYENGLDTCPFVPNTDESPRVSSGPDGDGIDSACDDGRDGGDVDADTYLNRGDNCPLVPNVSQADADLDGIGDDCDPIPGVPDGASIQLTITNAVTVAPAAETDLAVELIKDESITVPEDIEHTEGDLDGDTTPDTTVTVRITNGASPTSVGADLTLVSSDRNKCVAHLVPESGDTLSEWIIGNQFLSKLQWTEPTLGASATRDVTRDYKILCSVPGSWADFEQIVANVAPLDALETDLLDNTDQNHVSVVSDPDIDDDTVANAADNCPWVANADQADAQLPPTIDLNSTSAGLTVYGADEGGESGWAVPTGDINGDGTDDLIIGASQADPEGRGNAGETYVIYGGSSVPSPLDLSGVAADLTVYGDDG